MADIPKHTVTTIKRHEWTIGADYSESSIARTLRDGLHFAQKEMEELGVNVEYDDAFEWRAGDGGQIVLFVDVEEDD
jgi:hypothetical protein